MILVDYSDEVAILESRARVEIYLFSQNCYFKNKHKYLNLIKKNKQ